MFYKWQIRLFSLGLAVCGCSENGTPDDQEPTPTDSDSTGATDSMGTETDVDAAPPTPEPNEPGDAAPPMVVDGSTPGCPELRAQGEDPLLSDFETSGFNIASVEGRAGQWFSYDDGSGGQQTREVVEDGSRVLHVSSSGWTIWGSGLGTTLSPASTPSRLCPYDVSAYSGLSFRARGEGRVRLRMAMPANTPVAEGGECTQAGESCYDWPGVWFYLTEDWQTHDVPFCSLVPEGWAGTAPEFDPEQLGGIHFQLQGEAEMWVDDLTFTRDDPGADGGACPAACPLDAAPPSANLTPDETWLVLSEQLTLHTFEQDTTSCGPLTRRYFSYVPAALEQPSAAPVLIALHGSSANAESFPQLMTRGRLDELAQRDGFIVVYGNAAPGAFTDPEVDNSGAWRQAYFDDGQVDDVDYLLRVLDDLQQRGVTDASNPVYLTGISNGGGMVLLAAKRAPERFAGIAPFMPFDGWEPTPVPNLRGTGLKQVLFGYAPGDPGMPEGYGETISQLPAQWGSAMGIPEELLASPTERQLEDVVIEGEDYDGASPAALATRDSEVIQRDVLDPNSGAHVRVLVFENAGHFWPNPVQDTEDWILDRWGFRNQDVDAADAVWEFFSQSEVAAP